jgi:hypothetical protein
MGKEKKKEPEALIEKDLPPKGKNSQFIQKIIFFIQSINMK